MTANQTLSNLNKISELTSSMLATARKGEWERVQEIEQQRKHIFDLTFPLNPDDISDLAAVAKQVQTISDLDKETMKLVAESSNELAGLAEKISTGRQAVNAYKDVAGR